MAYPFLEQILQPIPGWYQGDLHTHTSASDGSPTPADLVQEAVDLGLDFVAITDHNTLEGLDELSPRPDLLIIPGLEVTLTQGHYNVLGMGGWDRWLSPLHKKDIGLGKMTAKISGPPLVKLMEASKARQLFTSLNHPLLKPWEWQEVDLPLSAFSGLEIWNDPTWEDNVTANPAAVDMWTKWLNGGHRHVAVGGSDYHGADKASGPYRPELAKPRTWVYAQSLSVAGILDGLKRRRAYLTMGPTISLTAVFDGFVVLIGDDLGSAGGTMQISIQTAGLPEGAVVQMVRRGDLVAETNTTSWQIAVELDPEQVNDWFRFDIRDAAGRLLTVTNPIFSGKRQEPKGEKFGDYYTWD